MEKKSEILKKQADEADHDLRALGLMTGAIREARLERFEEKYLPILLKQGIDITHDEKNHCYIFECSEGLVNFYPKANKLLIRKKNQWIKPGLQWIVKHVVVEDTLG